MHRANIPTRSLHAHFHTLTRTFAWFSMCKYFALQRPPSAWKAPGCSYRRYPVCVCLVRTLVTRTVGKEFPPLSPAFVLHSASKVLYPALALAHTHTLNRIRHLLQLPFPFGLTKFKRGCEVEDGDSQHGKLLKIYEAFGPLLHSSNYRHAYFILGLH